MDLARAAVLAAGWGTWGAFAVCMRCYFRRARDPHPAKRRLTRWAFACTLADLVVLTLPGPPGRLAAWAGVGGYAAAQGLFWWALAAHGRRRPAFAGVPVAPAAFVRAGPYRLVRHPIYTAYLLAWLAGAAATGCPWLLLPVALMGTLYYRAARQEEDAFLNSPFAPHYRDYQRGTGMFLPRLSA